MNNLLYFASVTDSVAQEFLKEGVLGAIIVAETIAIVVLARYVVKAKDENKQTLKDWRDDLLNNREKDVVSREKLADAVNNMSDKIETGRRSR